MSVKWFFSLETGAELNPEGQACMTPENSKMIWDYIRGAGDKLIGRLPPSNRHPGGRNSYAHVAICVKHKFGGSYKDLPDEIIEEIIEYIDWLVENPS